MFDEAMMEFGSSIKLLKNKFKTIESKTRDITGFSTGFHETTDKLEALYKKDIQKRKEYYQEHKVVKKALFEVREMNNIDYAPIVTIF